MQPDSHLKTKKSRFLGQIFRTGSRAKKNCEPQQDFRSWNAKKLHLPFALPNWGARTHKQTNGRKVALPERSGRNKSLGHLELSSTDQRISPSGLAKYKISYNQAPGGMPKPGFILNSWGENGIFTTSLFLENQDPPAGFRRQLLHFHWLTALGGHRSAVP